MTTSGSRIGDRLNSTSPTPIEAAMAPAIMSSPWVTWLGRLIALVCTRLSRL